MAGLMALRGTPQAGVTGNYTFDATLARLGEVTFVKVVSGRFQYLGHTPPGP
jgi:hypothetical protein